YKDKSGTYGCVDLHCPHRRADLSYGMVEDCGLRCNYHGWAFDENGNCIDQPFEQIAHPEANFKDRIKIKAYKVKPAGGLVCVYRRVREDTGEWTQGQIALWPNCLLPGNHFEWRVPIDDFNTLSVGWFMDRIPGTRSFEQEVIPYWWSPIKDEKTGRWVSSHI